MTKADLQERVDELQEMCDAAAEALTDPALDDYEACVEAIEHLRFRTPDFLADDEEDWEDDNE